MTNSTHRLLLLSVCSGIIWEALRHVAHPLAPHIPEEPLDSSPTMNALADCCTDAPAVLIDSEDL